MKLCLCLHLLFIAFTVLITFGYFGLRSHEIKMEWLQPVHGHDPFMTHLIKSRPKRDSTYWLVLMRDRKVINFKSFQ